MSAEGEERGSDSYDSKCIFCRISNNQESDCELLHSDEELVCFKDIRPGAPYHYLVVPKKHVGNCKTLTSDHVQLGEMASSKYGGSRKGCAPEKQCDKFGGYKVGIPLASFLLNIPFTSSCIGSGQPAGISISNDLQTEFLLVYHSLPYHGRAVIWHYSLSSAGGYNLWPGVHMWPAMPFFAALNPLVTDMVVYVRWLLTCIFHVRKKWLVVQEWADQLIERLQANVPAS